MNVRFFKRRIPFAGVGATMLVSALCASQGCSEEECYQNKNSLPLAGFYSSEPKPQAIALSKITIFGIGAPGDSILHDNAQNLRETYLPFRIDCGESSYVFRYLTIETGDGTFLADTVTFRYDIVPWFVSSACGAVYNYEMREITTTRHAIDSVTCPAGEITNMAAENLRIYFRVG